MNPDSFTIAEMDAVYAERNQCVALIARMAQVDGLRVGLRQSSDFQIGWQKCVMIDLPTGQVSWHLKDSELHLFDFPEYTAPWDGHTTEQKYQRVNAAFQLSQADIAQIAVLTIDAKKIMAEATLRIDLAALATEMLRNTPDCELSPEHLALKQRLDQAQANQIEITKIIDRGEIDVDLNKKFEEAWAKIDQAPASTPPMRWDVDLTNMDSQAPMSQPYKTITDTSNAKATYAVTPAEDSDPMLHSEIVMGHAPGARSFTVTLPLNTFDHSVPED